MTSLRTPSKTSNRTAPCPRCQTSGTRRYPFLALVCSACHGAGRVPLVESVTVEEEATYLATTAAEIIDVGSSLKSFVDDLLAAWELDDEDIAIWMLRDDSGPRLVCVLRPGVSGQTAVTWI